MTDRRLVASLAAVRAVTETTAMAPRATRLSIVSALVAVTGAGVTKLGTGVAGEVATCEFGTCELGTGVPLELATCEVATCEFSATMAMELATCELRTDVAVVAMPAETARCELGATVTGRALGIPELGTAVTASAEAVPVASELVAVASELVTATASSELVSVSVSVSVPTSLSSGAHSGAEDLAELLVLAALLGEALFAAEGVDRSREVGAQRGDRVIPQRGGDVLIDGREGLGGLREHGLAGVGESRGSIDVLCPAALDEACGVVRMNGALCVNTAQDAQSCAVHSRFGKRFVASLAGEGLGRAQQGCERAGRV